MQSLMYLSQLSCSPSAIPGRESVKEAQAMRRSFLAAVVLSIVAGVASAQVGARPGGRGATAAGPGATTGSSPVFRQAQNSPFVFSQQQNQAMMNQNNQGGTNQNLFNPNQLIQNPALVNQIISQNPALQNFLNQNPVMLNQLKKNPAFLNQLLAQHPDLLTSINSTGTNTSGLNTSGFPFFGGAFFPFGPSYGYSYGPGYSLPDTSIAATTAGTAGDDAWAEKQKNAARWSQTYREMRQYDQSQKRARDRHSPEALAKAAEVPRLGRDELDPLTGKISWPAPLMTDDFAKFRDEIERLFELRAWTTQRADASARIRELVHSMGDVLRLKIDELTADDFVNARKFLDGVEVAAVSARI
jgi:hypothetical protein